MGLKSALDASAAASRLQAAGRVIPFGLINQSKMAAPGYARQERSEGARAAGIRLFLVLISAGLGCVPLCGIADTRNNNFETPPPDRGSVQWNNNQQTTRERQEHYRKRLLIPDAVGSNVTLSATASLVNGQKLVAAPPPAPLVTPRAVQQAALFAAVLGLSGFLLVRRFAPQIMVELNRRYNPWALAPVAAVVPSARIREEEEAFGEFLKVFRIGPDAANRAHLRRPDGPHHEFFARAKERLLAQRKLLHDIGREPGDLARQDLLTKLCFEVGGLKDEAGFPEGLPVWQAASAMEGLLKQLTGKVRCVTPSTLRTVAGGLDLLDDLCVPGLPPDLLSDPPLRFLVVDDDRISCQALSISLEKAFSQPDLAENGTKALVYATSQAYDAIFLDVQMPGMDGFELCTKIRETVPNRTTPVVFVTIQSDFEARCKSTLSGGSELLGKPFLTFEITVKALTLALHGRLREHAPKPLPRPEPGRSTAAALATDAEAPRPVIRPAPSRPAPLELVLPMTDELPRAFLARAAKQLESLQKLCQTLLQIPDDETRQIMLVDGFLRMNSLISKPAPEVVHPGYQMSAALEGLFRKMLQDSRHATPSALATVATAVDLLSDLCSPGVKTDLATRPPIHMLVVDDDLVARRVLVSALQTAFKKPESAENGEAALALVRENSYDVIFLDVLMPGMDGFVVCSKIRETALNRATPVVFVTAQPDADTHAGMIRSGGDGVLGKAFLTTEITVKALTFALRGRLRKFNDEPAPAEAFRERIPETDFEL
jgi:CheY-like chemotaxis protein